MGKFLINVAGFLVVQAAILTAVIATTASVDEQGYVGSTLDKHAAVEALSGEAKILLVGGSSVAFGISAAEMSGQLEMPVVNLGLHAGFGNKIQLNEAIDLAESGDIVVLSIEYGIFSPEYLPNASRVAGLVERRPSTIAYVDWPTLRHLADNGLYVIGDRVKLALRVQRNDPTLLRPPYSRASFNSYGDVVGHHALAPVRPMPVANVANTVGRVAEVENEIADAVATLARNGVTVLYTYPPLPDERFEANQPSIARVRDALQAVSDLIVLDEPASLPEECFFDTEAHLVETCAQARTAALIEKVTPFASES